MTKIEVVKTAKELSALLAGRANVTDEPVENALMDSIRILWKYKAIEDIVLRPGGMEGPGAIKVEDILNPNAEVCETRDGWELRTWETKKAEIDASK